MKRYLVLTGFLLAAMTALLSGVYTTAAAAPGPWQANYFANPNLGGAPALSRQDDAINFSWGTGSPAPGLPNDNFSIRWQRDEWFAGGTYRFHVLADDGVRVWVGDELVVDEWRDRWAEPLDVDHYIATGTYHVRVEYYDHTGAATMSIGWQRVVGGATWRGEYFNCRDMNCPLVLTRDDKAIDFDWATGSPDPAVTPDNFSVRWTRTLDFPSGDYRFLASCDDGARVWVDGRLVVDGWKDNSLPKTYTGDVSLADGQHTITVEYYEHAGNASAHVWWKAREPFAAWHGEYFDNRDMVGGPALERDDAEINFDWGTGPPVSWMPDDNFSVRWSRTVNFAPGYYRFALRADDGARLWLDQSIIIDKWQDMDYELHYVDGVHLSGPHTVKLEYYEHTGSARVHFWWENGTEDNSPPSFQPATPAHQSPNPAPAAGITATPGKWAAAYFANTGLRGEPVLTRTETTLDHNWGWRSPGDDVPVNYFSARWTQSLHLDSGVYRFTTYSDDGVRLWVDGRLLISSWRPMRGHRSGTMWLDGGIHQVQVEYYERTGVALIKIGWQRIAR